jgi:hypothetical protein
LTYDLLEFGICLLNQFLEILIGFDAVSLSNLLEHCKFNRTEGN